MAAIITADFRINAATAFIDKIQDTTDNLYAFVGKPDPWDTELGASPADETPPATQDSQHETSMAIQNIIGLKKIDGADIIHMIPRHDWVYNRVYSQWDDSDQNLFYNTVNPFYVVTEDGATGAISVYKCLYTPVDEDGVYRGSTAKPDHIPLIASDGSFDVSTPDPKEYDDGYVWKYMFTVPTKELKFVTTSYVPVKNIAHPLSNEDYEALDTDDALRYDHITASKLGAKSIYAYRVIDGGSNYISAPTVVIDGNGSDATATASIDDNGIVVHVAPTEPGESYDIARVILSGGSGSGAQVHPILAPRGGHGTNHVEELGGFFAGVTTKFVGGDEEDFPIGLRFRQVGLMLNPSEYTSIGVDVAESETLAGLTRLVLSDVTNVFVPGDYLVNGDLDPLAYIDTVEIDGDNVILGVHQNDKTGYNNFYVDDVLSGYNFNESVTGTGTLDDVIDSEYVKHTGKIVFLENRTPVLRESVQTEDLKIIVEF
jgi:hypothetical protein